MSDQRDIVEILRTFYSTLRPCVAAADEIASLRAENERLNGLIRLLRGAEEFKEVVSLRARLAEALHQLGAVSAMYGAENHILKTQLASVRKAAIEECIAIINGDKWCKFADGTVSPLGACARALRVLLTDEQGK